MPTYPPPSVLVRNELDPKTGVHITQIACKFIFDDGHNDNPSKNTNVAPGGQETLSSTYTDCCRAYFVLMTVRYPDNSTEVLSNSTTVDSGYCGGQLTWHLVPAKQVLKSWTGTNPALEIVPGL